MGYVYPGERVDLGADRGWLGREAANSIFRIDGQLGHLLQITEAGRDWDQQNAHYQTYLRVGYPIALSPDAPSIHQKGGAIDSNEAQRIVSILEDHGWRRTVYRWVNGVWTLVEPWHFEYFAHLDNHRYDPTPAGEADIMNPNQEAKLDQAVQNIAIVKQLLSETQQWKGIGMLVSETYTIVGVIKQLLVETEQWTGMDTRLSQVLGVVTQLQAAIAEGDARDSARDAALEAAVRSLAAGTGADADELARVVREAAKVGAADSLAQADFPTEESIAQAVLTQQEKARLASLEAEVARLQGELDHARATTETEESK